MTMTVGVGQCAHPPDNIGYGRKEEPEEIVFYAATTRRDKQLQVCARGETIIYTFTTHPIGGVPSTQVRYFSLNNAAWVYVAKKTVNGKVMPSLTGLVLYEQSVEYDIMTGDNFNVSFTTLVVRDMTTRREKIRFDPASVVNNITRWSQKHQVKQTHAPQG